MEVRDESLETSILQTERRVHIRKSMFVILWTYDVRPGAEAAFEKVYGPSGEWVALFKQAEGYLGTELLCAAHVSLRYLTIDKWESEAAYNRFRTTYALEYEMVDRAGDGLTEAETLLGEFRK